MMNQLIKILLLLVYALGFASFMGWFTAGENLKLPYVAAGLLAIHLLEMVVAFKFIKTYSGGLAKSLGLTLLFGVLHWKPLADAVKKSA